MATMRLAWLAVSTLVAIGSAAGCGDNRAVAPDAAQHRFDATGADAAPDAPPDAVPQPTTLAGTGLCLDDACTMISATAIEYAPQYVLWADAASKRRWIELPAGTQIDTTDMDHWVFPVGTKIWKEFTDTDGTRIETRYMTKVSSPDSNAAQAMSWYFVAYQWNAAQDAAVAVPNGFTNPDPTQHDIPSVSQCQNCHDKLNPSHVLGFGALSLDYKAPSGILDLDGAAAAGMLTTNPTGAATPHYPLPGTAEEKAALGYLHANCGHCHNSTSDLVTNNQTALELRLDTAHLDTVAHTRTYETAVDVKGTTLFPGPADCPAQNCPAIPNCPGIDAPGDPQTGSCIVTPGDPTDSTLFFRFTSLDFFSTHMPETAVKTTDPTGVTTLRTWITDLPH